MRSFAATKSCEALAKQDEPDGLSLEKLRKNLPVRWDEQEGVALLE